MTNRTIASLVLLAGIFVMEGYDIAAMGLAVARLDEALGLEPASFGWVFTALLVGIGVGGALLAPYGDRFGRRALIVAGAVATGVFTLATSTATTVTEFLVWRGLTGIALGAALPNVSALSAELAPARLRATVMAVVSAGIPFGIFLAGVLSPNVVGAFGWQGLFYVPGILALLLAVCLWGLLDGGPPESADKDGTAKAPQILLFRQPWIIPFAVFAVMLGFNAMNLYLLNSWLPTFLPQAGFEQDLADRVSGIVQFAGIIIGVVASFGIDRWNKSWTLVLMFGAMALCFFAVSVSPPDRTLWTLLLCVGVGGASAGGMVLPALCVYMFAPRLLSTAIGMGVMVARLGAFAGPLIGQAVLNAEGGPQTYFFIAGIPAAICALAALAVPLGLRVKQRDEAAATA
ncbi:MFS transporter [Aurantiacibacter sp. MUD11]|uniref:MFS transporter n=1 Tax=Aurantiacibacter sp. MUD11 TaxID=3003265 RepID=UPI0022AB0963|nr:MFS transporter [Aurantiacibacter sp. MUD11]WAT17523.1 MFS transporter [Aurantiacibacter sp. MUD11]